MASTKITAKFLPNNEIRIATKTIPVALRSLEVQTNSRIEMMNVTGGVRIYFSPNKMSERVWKVTCTAIHCGVSCVRLVGVDKTSFAKIQDAYTANGYAE
jgi:hypothetical protein